MQVPLLHKFSYLASEQRYSHFSISSFTLITLYTCVTHTIKNFVFNYYWYRRDIFLLYVKIAILFMRVLTVLTQKSGVSDPDSINSVDSDPESGGQKRPTKIEKS
jgi:hypothetical protein